MLIRYVLYMLSDMHARTGYSALCRAERPMEVCVGGGGGGGGLCMFPNTYLFTFRVKQWA